VARAGSSIPPGWVRAAYLAGTPGRRATARMLLWECRQGEGKITGHCSPVREWVLLSSFGFHAACPSMGNFC